MPQLLLRHLGSRLAAFVMVVFLLLTLETLFRGLFFVRFWSFDSAVSYGVSLRAFRLGLKFDLRVAVVLSLPFLLLCWFPFLNPFARRTARVFWGSFYALMGLALVTIYLIDFGHYSYLESRMNATVLTFLNNPLISAEMVWQSYPVGWAILGIAVTGYGFYWALRRWVFTQESTAKEPVAFTWKRSLALGLATSCLVALGLYGRFSQYPLRWSQAFFSGNNFVSNWTMNPLHYFFDTLSNRTKTFDREAVKAHYDLVADYFGVREKDLDRLQFLRPVELTGQAPNRPNIVYIVMESMAAYKTGIFGNNANTSPAFDALAREGHLFTHFFTPTEATARSMFCLLTGIPDFNSGGRNNTSSRNPLIVNQNTLVNAFPDYQKFYFLGGSANWGNIRGVYEYNINGVEIYEEGRFKSARSDVWGISDLHLFEEANTVLNEYTKSDRPFFAIIQSAGFHRPYTIPEDRRDFQIINLPPDELAKHGFHSNEEYNSFRFQDYSLGRFMELAKRSPYFDNTIFVIHGDHGLPEKNAQHTSLGMKELMLTRFHVPLVFYSPKILGEPKVIETVASEPDVMATLAGITNHQGLNTTFGRNLYAVKPGEQRYAMTFVFYREPPYLGLIDQEFFLASELGRGEKLHRYKSEDPLKDVKNEHPEKYKEMSQLLKGLYETAKYMLYHNPNLYKANEAKR